MTDADVPKRGVLISVTKHNKYIKLSEVKCQLDTIL